MLLSDLPELINIIDEIIADNDPDQNLFFESEENENAFIETCLQLMYDYVEDNPSAICEPDFEENIIDNVKELFSIHFNFDYNILLEVDDAIDDAIDDALELFHLHFMPMRSCEGTLSIKKNAKQLNQIEKQITKLENLEQPVQRTKEWYEFRHNLITASNAYKAFENQSSQNQLIFEKCQPVKSPCSTDEVKTINVDSPLHWGQKYEPISVLYYEDMYSTKVKDFGCIRHEKYSFLGASPDGIISDKTLRNYGRMLEIKNPVSREIDGIPIKEYWIQMQLQMETCDLDECDFLETKFVEYTSETDFKEDGNDFLTSAKGELKGIIMYFSNNEGVPHYVYKPLRMDHECFEKWEQEMMEEKEKNSSLTWIKNIYWKLEDVSCILVLRNKKWFNDNIEALQNIWTTIEKERNDGFAHRAPNKRPKKAEMTDELGTGVGIGCLLSMDKTSGKIGINNNNIIIKIRTESFDESKLVVVV